MLYHYTNVETLALILSNQTVRFNALNKVDDLQEQETADIRNLGQFVFVSCWTEEKEEQIPMWKMYGSIESGVRIGMKKYPFQEHENKPEMIEKVTGQHVDDKTNGAYMKSLITGAEMIEKGFIVPGLVKQENILYKVEYTTDIDLLYPQVKFEDEKGTTLKFDKLGKYKNEGWKFQKEWRYILPFYPLDISNMETVNEKAQRMMERMIAGIETLPFTYYDIKIDTMAFSEMEIMLSPKLSVANRLIVNDLIEKYNPNATVIESEYKGLIA